MYITSKCFIFAFYTFYSNKKKDYITNQPTRLAARLAKLSVRPAFNGTVHLKQYGIVMGHDEQVVVALILNCAVSIARHMRSVTFRVLTRILEIVFCKNFFFENLTDVVRTRKEKFYQFCF